MTRRSDETLDLSEIELQLNKSQIEGSGRRGETVRILYDYGEGFGGKVSITLDGKAPSIPTLMKWASREMAGYNTLFHGMVRRKDGSEITLKYGTFLSYPTGFGTAPVTFTFSFEIIGQNN